MNMFTFQLGPQKLRFGPARFSKHHRLNDYNATLFSPKRSVTAIRYGIGNKIPDQPLVCSRLDPMFRNWHGQELVLSQG